jgi:aminoglycoside/choline kinase family phosphotransferase
MVDIQDARWGPDSYDLASLLRDAYIEVPEEWIGPAIQSYLARLSDPPSEDGFRDRFEVVSAQRMIKALGTFGYQVTVLGRRRYESAIGRVVARLRSWQPRSERARRALDALTADRVL